MKTNRSSTRPGMTVLGGVLMAMTVAAHADRALAQEAIQTTKSSTIEVGVGDVTDGSYKAGEYNGLEGSGAFAIANIDLRDRATYGSASALRWRLTTHDLGLETRSANGDIGIQGKFRVRLGIDRLRRNRSDSYQTPYDGAGSNMLTLPANWLVPTIASPAGNTVSARGLIRSIGVSPYLSTAAANQGAVLNPTAAQATLVDAAIGADLPAFHSVNLFTTRTKYDIGLNYTINDRWGLDASIRPEHKDGLKPMGTVSRNTGGDISTIIPDVIDTDTNQFSTSLNFKSARTFAQFGYYGSFFTNHVSSMSWQNWATATHTLNTMSSTPSNSFSQVNATASFKMGATTKLVTTGSYGRGTQNDAFLTDTTTPIVPVRSLNALIVSTLLHAKLTSRPAKKLNVSAAFKYDDRDNRTAVNIYQFADAGEAPVANTSFPAGANNPLGAVLAQNANANRPYSRRMNQATFDADYAVGPGQWVKGGYDFEKIDRSCGGSWISCADAATTTENTARVEWRATAGANVTARIGYAYSQRRGAYNENAFLALVPYANVSPASATGGATALSFMNANGWNGYGPALGFAATTGNANVFFGSNNALANAAYANNNRISELQGFRRYWVADRNRDKVRSSLMWQGGDTVSFQGGVDFNRDDYVNTTYGLQNAKGWAANADVTYTPRDNLSADVFYTYENQRGLSTGNTYTANSNAATIANGQAGAVGLSGNSCDSYTTLQQRNNNNKLDPCLNWSADTQDGANTVGFGLRTKAGKVDLTGNIFFTRARSDYGVTGGNWANNVLNGQGGAPTTIAAFYIPATAFPTVTSDTSEFRLNGTIPVAKAQSLRIAYTYMHMTSSDWVYAGMQIGLGTIAGVLPSNEQAFNYKVSVVAVSYFLTF
jgi:MtrB/PioB family decaheme-associated outer membrane protein